MNIYRKLDRFIKSAKYLLNRRQLVKQAANYVLSYRQLQKSADVPQGDVYPITQYPPTDPFQQYLLPNASRPMPAWNIPQNPDYPPVDAFQQYRLPNASRTMPSQPTMPQQMPPSGYGYSIGTTTYRGPNGTIYRRTTQNPYELASSLYQSINKTYDRHMNSKNPLLREIDEDRTGMLVDRLWDAAKSDKTLTAGMALQRAGIDAKTPLGQEIMKRLSSRVGEGMTLGQSAAAAVQMGRDMNNAQIVQPYNGGNTQQPRRRGNPYVPQPKPSVMSQFMPQQPASASVANPRLKSPGTATNTGSNSNTIPLVGPNTQPDNYVPLTGPDTTPANYVPLTGPDTTPPGSVPLVAPNSPEGQLQIQRIQQQQKAQAAAAKKPKNTPRPATPVNPKPAAAPKAPTSAAPKAPAAPAPKPTAPAAAKPTPNPTTNTSTRANWSAPKTTQPNTPAKPVSACSSGKIVKQPTGTSSTQSNACPPRNCYYW